MIVLSSIKKTKNRRIVFTDLNATFQARSHYVIFGLPQSGKSTLLGLVCGLQRPSKGKIRRYGSVTPPIGSPGVLVAGATVQSAAALYSAIYRVNPQEYSDFIKDFSGWPSLDIPATVLPPDVRLRLAFAFGYGLPADFYLFDGNVGYGRGDFAKQCRLAFECRQKDAATIYTTGTVRNAEQFGDIGGVLNNGVLTLFESVAEAAEVFKELEYESKKGTMAGAEVLAAQGRFAEARDCLVELLRVNDTDIGSHLLLANVANRAGSAEIALEALERLVLLDPDNRETYHSLIVQTASRSGQLQTAIQHLECMVELRPEDSDLKLQLATLYLRQGEDRSAVAVWRQLAAEGVRGPEALAAVRAAIRLQDWTVAVELIDLCLGDRPNDLTLLEMKGQSQLYSGDYDAFKTTTFTIAEFDLSKALGSGLKVLSSLSPDQIYDLLVNLHERHRFTGVEQKLVSRYLINLEFLARARHQKDDVEERDRIRKLATQLKLAGQPE